MTTKTKTTPMYELPDEEREGLGAAGAAVDRLSHELYSAQTARAELVRASLARHGEHRGAASAVARASGLTKTGVQKIARGWWHHGPDA